MAMNLLTKRGTWIVAMALSLPFASCTVMSEGDVIDDSDELEEQAGYEGDFDEGGDSGPPEDSLIGALYAKGGKGKGGGDKSYNCKPDKGVDQAVELQSVEVLSAMKVHLQASAGSDESGTVIVYRYLFENDAGQVVSIAPKASQACPLAKVDDANDFIVERLIPETHYTVRVESKDACGNRALSSAWEFDTPTLISESNAPLATTPKNTRVSVFFSSAPGVALFVNDDTGVDRVEFYANGIRQFDNSYSANELLGWSPEQDPGEVYYAMLDGNTHGTTAYIEVYVYDVHGNLTISATDLAIPNS